MFWLAAAVMFCSSCVPHKEMAYLQELQEGVKTIPSGAPRSATLHPHDIIQVNITSLSPQANEMLQYNQSNSNGQYGANSYLVNEAGMIDLPMVGEISVEGLSTAAAADSIKGRLGRLLQQPSVNVRLLNFTITVLGEVNNPGRYEVPGAQVNILEALGMAGDLTIYGKRKSVLLVREQAGKREYHRLDLTMGELLDSPYYTLQNNDVIYIEPSKGRTSSDDNIYRVLPVVLSSLTFLTVIITNIIP